MPRKGCFPRRWKTAKIIPIKPGKENSMEPSKYCPISLLNIGGNILEKLIELTTTCTRTNYWQTVNTDLRQKEYNRCSHRGKKIIGPELEKRRVVIMTSPDVKGAFNAAWWPSILKSLKDAECTRNLYYLSRGYFSQRTATVTNNSISIERRVTKGCPQGSCCGPGYWNLLQIQSLNWNLQTTQK